MKNILYSFLIIFALFLTGCADAGKNQTVSAGETVTLDASASTPILHGSISKYEWKQTRGTKVELSNKNAASPTFTAPTVETKTNLVFRLITTETGGIRSPFRTRDYVTITVNPQDNTDRTPPVITLLGDSPTMHIVGEPYIDAGATASDNIDGNITSKIVTTGSVDISTEGNYTITYNVTDAADNDATEVTRIVIVKRSDEITPTVSGTITDINGSSISGALVTIGTETVSTNMSGIYTIENVTPAERVTVNVTHPDYLSNSRIVEVVTEDMNLDVKLDVPKASRTFSATEGGTVTQGTASVALPAEGYVDANGSSYTGEIIAKMSYYPITTQSGRAAFPGTFEGIEGNNTFPIQSYGFMNVELTDPQGNKLNLDGNSTATLTFPRDSSLRTPATVPLWYYDEAQGYWIQEGSATNSGHYSTFVGTVTHFTSWNLDAKGPRATFKGCVEDENGTRVPNAWVSFRSLNWDSYIRPTDENGSISVYNILAQTNLTFSAYRVIDNIIYYGDKTIFLSEGEDKVDNNCIVLTPQPNLSDKTIIVSGTLIDYYSKQPAGNEDVSVYAIVNISGRTTRLKVGSGTSNNNGTFSITFKTSYDALIYRAGQGYESNSFTLQTNKSTYDVGSVIIHMPN